MIRTCVNAPEGHVEIGPMSATANPHHVTEIENPLHRLTPEQIEEIGEAFQKIHDEVYRRPRRATTRTTSARSSSSTAASPPYRASC